MNVYQENFIKKYSKNINVKLFFIIKLPSLWFWGARILHLDTQSCQATVSYKWRTKNPFNSIYFATQAGVAEISTGLLCQTVLAGRGKWSMYVTAFEAEYGITAKGLTTFTCKDGHKVSVLIDQLEKTGKPGKVVMISEGTNKEGKMVSRFKITWSFKKKTKQ